MADFALYPAELDGYQSNFKINSHKSLFKDTRLLPQNTNRVTKLFRPLRIILTILGRWPFKLQPLGNKNNNCINFNKGHNNKTKSKSRLLPFSQTEADLTSWIQQRIGVEGLSQDLMESNKSPSKYFMSYKYTSSLKSPVWIYFILTTLFLVTVLFFSVLGFCDFFLEWNLFAKSSWDEIEKKNFESNLVPFVLVWSCLMHSSLSSISVLTNRRKMAKFLNYWDYAVDTMDIEMPVGIKKYIIGSALGFFGFLVVIFIAYKILYLNLVRGGALLVGILTFRPIIFMFDIRKDLFKIRIFGMVTLLYSVYASRAFLLLFSFKCKILKHSFKICNGRFKTILFSPPFKTCKEEQVKCEKVLADYAILLKLVKLTDNVFGITLQSYYGSQLMNMCFELYYLARSGIYSESSLDIIGALVVLVQNLYIFFTVSLDAAYVNEEATRGWEILRRRGINPLDSVHKKYMISNMQMIFSQKIVLTGGRYFSVDRPFIVTVLGAVFTYFIIVLQVGPSLHKKIEES